ncbi:rCG37087, partial [Rattus norvegicus]
MIILSSGVTVDLAKYKNNI